MKSAMKLDGGRRQRPAHLNKKHVTRVASETGKSRRSAAPLQIRNVLVPVDFSAPSLSAVEFAVPLIKRFGAHLHLVHVFAKDYPITALVAMSLVLPISSFGQMKFVRYSPRPVLVVRGGDREQKASRWKFSRRALGFRKVLVPIDFSECSMKGLAYAKAFARQFIDWGFRWASRDNPSFHSTTPRGKRPDPHLDKTKIDSLHRHDSWRV
jgi:nucleotide-binding universal stress UspA family protein